MFPSGLYIMSKPKAIGVNTNAFNFASQDFIPVACHYDQFTVLTKNGELMQTIQISGEFSQNVGEDLLHLREAIRATIKKNIKSDAFAVWIHTVRRKTDLNDPAKYPNILSANIHDIWKDKNYWDDKFINTLYVTIVYNRTSIKISSVNSFISTLSTSLISKFHDDYFAANAVRLTNVVDSILQDLKPLGVARLGIKEENGVCYSEPLFLLRRIINLKEEDVLLPIVDCASALATNHYAVGNDQIEVIDESGKKFAAILSIKEYHETSEESLNHLLKLSVEFVATEVFYFVPKKEAIKDIAYSDYILTASRDEELRKAKGLDVITSTDDGFGTNFCMQQISIMIIGNDVEQLDNDVAKASSELSYIGIVHVKEDIKLEQTFWAQLPGNFSFLRRVVPTIIDNTAALASLHNFPSGNAKSPWGAAITLLRTAAGSPHFMNFHNASGVGHTVIFGPHGSGRSVVMNFMLSEALKFNPTVIYATNSGSADIFIDAIGGAWQDLNSSSEVHLEPGQITGFNLKEVTADQRYEFFKTAMEFLGNAPTNEPKIFAINNMALLFADSRLDETIGSMLELLHKNNGIILSTINLHRYGAQTKEPMWKELISRLGCRIVLSDDENDLDLKTLIGLTATEEKKIHSFSAISRLFLMTQDNRSLALELSLGGLSGVFKMLSCQEEDLEIYRKVRAESDPDGEDWVIKLYDKLR